MHDEYSVAITRRSHNPTATAATMTNISVQVANARRCLIGRRFLIHTNTHKDVCVGKKLTGFFDRVTRNITNRRVHGRETFLYIILNPSARFR